MREADMKRKVTLLSFHSRLLLSSLHQALFLRGIAFPIISIRSGKLAAENAICCEIYLLACAKRK